MGSSAPGAKLNSLPLHKNVLDAIRNRDQSGAEKATLILLEEALEDVETIHRTHTAKD